MKISKVVITDEKIDISNNPVSIGIDDSAILLYTSTIGLIYIVGFFEMTLNLQKKFTYPLKVPRYTNQKS